MSIVVDASVDFESFYTQRTLRLDRKSGPLLIASVDGKGVPLVKPTPPKLPGLGSAAPAAFIAATPKRRRGWPDSANPLWALLVSNQRPLDPQSSALGQAELRPGAGDG